MSYTLRPVKNWRSRSKGFAPAAGPPLSACWLGWLLLACWLAGWRPATRPLEGGSVMPRGGPSNRPIGGWKCHARGPPPPRPSNTPIGGWKCHARRHTTTIHQTGWLQEGSHTGCRKERMQHVMGNSRMHGCRDG